MSYIVAFVVFTKKGRAYPVNCWRSDICEGDAVIVRMNTKQGALQRGNVVSLAYLNWACVNAIECKADEASMTPKGITLPSPSLRHNGINRPVDVWNVIRDYGWSSHRTRGKLHLFACSARHGLKICQIYFRRNGADIQIADPSIVEIDEANVLTFHPTLAPVERMSCLHTEGRFYTYLCEVAKAFVEDGEYGKIAKPTVRKRELPWSPPLGQERDHEEQEEADSRDVFLSMLMNDGYF